MVIYGYRHINLDLKLYTTGMGDIRSFLLYSTKYYFQGETALTYNRGSILTDICHQKYCYSLKRSLTGRILMAHIILNCWVGVNFRKCCKCKKNVFPRKTFFSFFFFLVAYVLSNLKNVIFMIIHDIVGHAQIFF